jgi:hypothetical protein
MSADSGRSADLGRTKRHLLPKPLKFGRRRLGTEDFRHHEWPHQPAYHRRQRATQDIAHNGDGRGGQGHDLKGFGTNK